MPDMQTPVISGYLRQLNFKNEAAMAEMYEIRNSMPEDQRELMFGKPMTQEEVLRQLNALPMPTDLKNLIIQDWPMNYCDVSPLEVFDIESIASASPAEFERLGGAGYLQIGKGPNGDLVVLNFNHGAEYPVGFLRMANLDLDSPDDGAIASAYRPIESSLERFLFRCVNELELPGDSYDDWSQSELSRPLNP